MNRSVLTVLFSFIVFSVTGAEYAGESETPHIIVNTMDTGLTVSIALSQDERILYSADEYAGTVKSWDTESGRLLRTFSGFDYIRGMTLSSDGKLLVVRSYARTTVIDSANGKIIREFKQQYFSSVFSPDGKALLLGATSTVKPLIMVNPITGETIREFKLNVVAYAAALRPDGKEIAVCGGDDKIHLFDATSGNETRALTAAADKADILAYSPDGENLLVSAPDKKAAVIESASGKIIYTLDDLPGKLLLAVYSPDGKSIAVGGDKMLRLVRARNGKILFECKSKNNQSTLGRSAVFTSEGKIIYSANFGLSAWDIENEKELAPIGGMYAAFCNGIAFSPDRRHIAFASDSSFRVIDMETGGIVFGSKTYLFPAINLFSYSADGSRLFAGSESVIQMFSCESGELLYENKLLEKISCAAVRADGKQIAFASGKRLAIGEPAAENKPQLLEMTEKIAAVAYSPDGKSLAVRGENSIRFLSTLTGKESFSIKCPLMISSAPLVFSPDGKFIAAGGFGQVSILSINARKIISTLKTIPRQDSLVFSPDGKILASCGEDTAVILWNTSTWKEQKILRGHTSRVKVVSFSPDGKLLVSGGADKIFRFWDLPEGESSGSVLLSSAVYSESSTVTTNGKVAASPVKKDIVRDFVVVAPSGLYDGTAYELGRLHWVVGNEIIPLSEFGENFRTPGLLGQILSKHVVRPPIDAAKRLFGKIRTVNGNDIVVSYSGAKSIAQIKERFTVFLDSGEPAEIEAVFPMLTNMKCRLVNPAKKTGIRPGMPVFR